MAVLQRENMLEEIYYMMGINYNFFRKLDIFPKNPNIDYNIRPNKYKPPPDPKSLELQRMKQELRDAEERKDRALEEQRLFMIKQHEEQQRLRQEEIRKRYYELYEEMTLVEERKNLFLKLLADEQA